MKLKEQHTLLPQDLTEADRQAISAYIIGKIITPAMVTDAWKFNCIDLIASANEMVDAAITKMMRGK